MPKCVFEYKTVNQSNEKLYVYKQSNDYAKTL